MILIVGLGNPEKKYDGTRHNIGFAVLDAFAKKFGAEFKMSAKYNSEIAQGMIQFDTKRVRFLLAKPQTYMNNSGDAVSKIVNFYKFRTDDQVWIVHDDLDIELGTIRIRLSGSSAGQKGIQSIIEKLGTDKFTRFRMGIKPEGGQRKSAEKFVLEKFKPAEKKVITQTIKEAVDLLIESCDKGVIQRSI